MAVHAAFACMGLNPSTRIFCITIQHVHKAKRALAESDINIIALVHRVKGKHQLLFLSVRSREEALLRKEAGKRSVLFLCPN